MSCYKKTASALLGILLCGVGLLWAEEEAQENSTEEELPLEEALALIDEVAPLPLWGEEPVEEGYSSLLPDESEEPDYELLRSLQLEDKIKEAVDRINSRDYGGGPIDSEEFFSTRENMFIRDPERYLTRPDQLQLQEILIAHAGESSHNIHLNLLGKNDVEIIDTLSEDSHIEILAGDDMGIVVYYFYDDPSRTVTYFSRKAKRVIPKEIRQRMTRSAIHEASIQGDSYQAVYRYVLDITLKVSNFVQAKNEEALSSLEEKEVVAPEPSVKKVSAARKAVDFISNLGMVPLLIILTSVLSVMVLVGLHFWNVGRRKHRYPVVDLPNHLGFPRARGCSGVMRFGKDAPNLKDQQDKIFR